MKHLKECTYCAHIRTLCNILVVIIQLIILLHIFNII